MDDMQSEQKPNFRQQLVMDYIAQRQEDAQIKAQRDQMQKMQQMQQMMQQQQMQQSQQQQPRNMSAVPESQRQYPMPGPTREDLMNRGTGYSMFSQMTPNFIIPSSTASA